MNTRTTAQAAIVARAAEEFGKGRGADNSTTGALILYIQDLEADVRMGKHTLRRVGELATDWERAIESEEFAHRLRLVLDGKGASS